MNYEKKALSFGIAINLFSAVIGFIFLLITKSQTLLLDTSISIILTLSTIVSLFITNKRDQKNNSSLENIFFLFRILLMIAIILFTIIKGIITIYEFYNNTLISNLNITLENMLIYGFLMTGGCFAITFTYNYYNHKLESPSKIIKIEIISSIFDGLVTFFSTLALLLFKYVSFLNSLEPIGDSIVAIILSIIYIFVPIKELINIIKSLHNKNI